MDRTYVRDWREVRGERFGLLSIISKDARGPAPGCDWSTLPFTRPRIPDVRIVELDKVRKMDPVNEEGFTVKFYPSHGEYVSRPQRITVKFDSYLTLVNAKNHSSSADILKLYIRNRDQLHTADTSE